MNASYERQYVEGDRVIIDGEITRAGFLSCRPFPGIRLWNLDEPVMPREVKVFETREHKRVVVGHVLRVEAVVGLSRRTLCIYVDRIARSASAVSQYHASCGANAMRIFPTESEPTVRTRSGA